MFELFPIRWLKIKLSQSVSKIKQMCFILMLNRQWLICSIRNISIPRNAASSISVSCWRGYTSLPIAVSMKIFYLYIMYIANVVPLFGQTARCIIITKSRVGRWIAYHLWWLMRSSSWSAFEKTFSFVILIWVRQSTIAPSAYRSIFSNSLLAQVETTTISNKYAGVILKPYAPPISSTQMSA